MSDLPAIPANSDILQLANQEAMAYVCWCAEYIADQHFLATLPPNPWAGRDQSVGACVKHFGIPESIAGNAVDQAVHKLWHQQREDPKHFLKQTLKLRLIGIKQLMIQAIKTGRTETFYKFERLGDIDPKHHPKGTPKKFDHASFVKIPVKQKEYSGSEVGLYQILLTVEKMLIELDGLDKETDQATINVIEQMFSQMANLAKNQEEEDDKGQSAAAKAKRINLANLKSEHQRLLDNIMTETASPEVQRVEVVRKTRGSKTRDPDEDDEPEEDNDDDDSGTGFAVVETPPPESAPGDISSEIGEDNERKTP